MYINVLYNIYYINNFIYYIYIYKYIKQGIKLFINSQYKKQWKS